MKWEGELNTDKYSESEQSHSPVDGQGILIENVKQKLGYIL